MKDSLSVLCIKPFRPDNRMVNYLVATGIEVGLILNVSEESVQVKRKVRNLKHLDLQD